MHYIFIAWYLVATFAVSEAETEIDIPTPPEGISLCNVRLFYAEERYFE